MLNTAGIGTGFEDEGITGDLPFLALHLSHTRMGVALEHLEHCQQSSLIN